MEVSGLSNQAAAHSVSTSTESKPVQNSEVTKIQPKAPTHQVQAAAVNEYKKHSNDNAGNGIRQHVQDIRNEEVDRQMKDIIDSINSKLTTNTEVNLAYHADSNRLNIKIIDKETKEIVKEWPSEKSLELLAKLIDKEAVVLDKRL